MDADLDTLATALYVRTDDLLKDHPQRIPWRPRVGIAPMISDAEMVTLSVMQALLGHTSEARWLRFADEHLRHLFPYLPKQSGYNKRLRRLGATLNWLMGALARDTSVWTDDVWVVDSTPVECARSRETVRRSDLAGWAEYGSCASHSRYFWGLRLHLVATLHGLPIGFALTGAKADERQVLLDLLHDDPTLAASRPGQILLADKNYFGREFEASIADGDIQLLRRARKGEPERAVAGSSNRSDKPSSRSSTRSKDSSIWSNTADTQRGVLVRVLQRLLAMTTAIWHNDHTGQPVRRSRLAYDD